MSIFEQLSKQQRQIDELFCDVRRALASEQRELAHTLFLGAANKLIACMRAEHATVYPRFADIDGLVGEVTLARQQHQGIEDVINTLRIGGLSGDAWDAELDRLLRLFAQHADLEELSMFPIASLSLSTKQLIKIGTDFATYLACSASVAGASITYEMAPIATIPRSIMIAPAPAGRVPPKVAAFELEDNDAVDEWEADTAYVQDRPAAA